jgi:hypothetical protein
MKGVLNRLQQSDVQTLGRFYLYDGLNEVFSCVVLELPDKQNQNNISRICGGVYTCKKRYSDKYKHHFHVTDVHGRKLILIHYGNYYTNTRGCILFGDDFAKINDDEYMDITNSKNTISDLMEIAPDEWELTINEV